MLWFDCHGLSLVAGVIVVCHGLSFVATVMVPVGCWGCLSYLNTIDICWLLWSWLIVVVIGCYGCCCWFPCLSLVPVVASLLQIIVGCCLLYLPPLSQLQLLLLLVLVVVVTVIIDSCCHQHALLSLFPMPFEFNLVHCGYFLSMCYSIYLACIQFTYYIN